MGYPINRGESMDIQSFIGVLGLGLILGSLAIQAQKAQEKSRKKVPVRVKKDD
jgi:hypothetical protein